MYAVLLAGLAIVFFLADCELWTMLLYKCVMCTLCSNSYRSVKRKHGWRYYSFIPFCVSRPEKDADTTSHHQQTSPYHVLLFMMEKHKSDILYDMQVHQTTLDTVGNFYVALYHSIFHFLFWFPFDNHSYLSSSMSVYTSSSITLIVFHIRINITQHFDAFSFP